MKKLFKKLKMNKRGFTLAECLISLTIIAIMSASMMTLFQQGIRFISKTQKLDSSAEQASQIIATGSTTSDFLNTEFGENYYTSGLPITIQFRLTTSETITLAPREFLFQAGVVKDERTNVKVVYYDISTEELKNIK